MKSHSLTALLFLPIAALAVACGASDDRAGLAPGCESDDCRGPNGAVVVGGGGNNGTGDNGGGVPTGGGVGGNTSPGDAGTLGTTPVNPGGGGDAGTTPVSPGTTGDAGAGGGTSPRTPDTVPLPF